MPRAADSCGTPEGATRQTRAIQLRVVETAPIALERDHDVARGYVLSPFVWPAGAGYEIVVRGVPKERNPIRKISSIYRGYGEGGVHFKIDSDPILAPSTLEDSGGCEDPTFVQCDDEVFVFYSGWSNALCSGTLLAASGRSLRDLTKLGPVLPPDERFVKPKEATIVRRPDRSWLMFFEFSRDGHSIIGTATSRDLRGPWTYGAQPFGLRAGAWDSWHLSTGPIISAPTGEPLMLYNGADVQGRWRIGWAMFDADYTRVLARCDEPLIAAPAPRTPFRDTAFSASGFSVDSKMWVYYSAYDTELYRAVVAIED